MIIYKDITERFNLMKESGLICHSSILERQGEKYFITDKVINYSNSFSSTSLLVKFLDGVQYHYYVTRENK